MFTGNYNFTLDSKSRVSIPSGFREYMLKLYNNRVTLTKNLLGQSIIIWPDPVYVRFSEKLLALPEGDEDAEELKMFFMAWAFQTEFDANGRIFVPQALRDHAKLQRDVVIAGMGHKIHIWSEEAWGDLNRGSGADTDRLRQIMKKFNISSM